MSHVQSVPHLGSIKSNLTPSYKKKKLNWGGSTKQKTMEVGAAMDSRNLEQVKSVDYLKD